MAMWQNQSWQIGCDQERCEAKVEMDGEPYWFGGVDHWLKEHPGWSVTADGWRCPLHSYIRLPKGRILIPLLKGVAKVRIQEAGLYRVGEDAAGTFLEKLDEEAG